VHVAALSPGSAASAPTGTEAGPCSAEPPAADDDAMRLELERMCRLARLFFLQAERRLSLARDPASPVVMFSSSRQGGQRTQLLNIVDPLPDLRGKHDAHVHAEVTRAIELAWKNAAAARALEPSQRAAHSCTPGRH
jgi:hypothetical protein